MHPLMDRDGSWGSFDTKFFLGKYAQETPVMIFQCLKQNYRELGFLH